MENLTEKEKFHPHKIKGYFNVINIHHRINCRSWALPGYGVKHIIKAPTDRTWPIRCILFPWLNHAKTYINLIDAEKEKRGLLFKIIFREDELKIGLNF